MKPASEIRDLWKVVGPFYSSAKGRGLQAWLRLVVRLDKPLTFKELKNDPNTREMSVVRKKFQGKTDITFDWPQLYSMIVKRNPKTKKALRQYHPA